MVALVQGAGDANHARVGGIWGKPVGDDEHPVFPNRLRD